MKLVYLCQNGKARSVAFAAYTNKYFLERGINEVECVAAGVALESIESLRDRERDLVSKTVAQILKTQNVPLNQEKINYVGEVIRGADLFISSDPLTFSRFQEDFITDSEEVFLARGVAGYSRRLDIPGPYSNFRKAALGNGWNERNGYEHMLSEIRKLSRRIVNIYADELFPDVD